MEEEQHKVPPFQPLKWTPFRVVLPYSLQHLSLSLTHIHIRTTHLYTTTDCHDIQISLRILFGLFWKWSWRDGRRGLLLCYLWDLSIQHFGMSDKKSTLLFNFLSTSLMRGFLFLNSSFWRVCVKTKFSNKSSRLDFLGSGCMDFGKPGGPMAS